MMSLTMMTTAVHLRPDNRPVLCRPHVDCRNSISYVSRSIWQACVYVMGLFGV